MIGTKSRRIAAGAVAATFALLLTSVTAFGVFFYITLMETVSVLENFAAIRPEDKRLKRLIKHLKLIGGNAGKENEYNDSEEE